ncbi:mycoredoxin [Nakamurella antarctica]|uniref:Mycoredoxin n=1 Tax=Nakamurella antarctica TaxID=1902245 RepID=A0A3G8ZI76_9ACTN|nr:mycoredoxin [Nakamurella antarctica]AZI57013.1 mycoredoxin [Nakamurella antarctica]
MSELTVYTTSWCPYCHRLAMDLDRAGIEFDDIDIEQTPDAATIVEGFNNGNRTVPTVVFADGTAMTNPSVAQVTAKLGS